MTRPGARAGAVAEISEGTVTTIELAGVPPNETVLPAVKFVPAIVTFVPPVAGPLFGVTEVTVGGSANAEDQMSSVMSAARAIAAPRSGRRTAKCEVSVRFIIDPSGLALREPFLVIHSRP